MSKCQGMLDGEKSGKTPGFWGQACVNNSVAGMRMHEGPEKSFQEGCCDVEEEPRASFADALGSLLFFAVVY